jgi:hypothetical protein
MDVTYDATQAPPGTTHVLPADPLGFDQRPTWMKWGYSFTGPESGRLFYRWYSWDRGEWVPDSSLHPRENTVIHELSRASTENEGSST